MKSIITAALILFATLSLNAQISSMYEANRFNKFMNKLSTSKGGVLSYDDVEGNPFFNKNFLSAPKVREAIAPCFFRSVSPSL